MLGSSVSYVSTTVPTCTDRTEIALEITVSAKACDHKRAVADGISAPRSGTQRRLRRLRS